MMSQSTQHNWSQWIENGIMPSPPENAIFSNGEKGPS